MISSLYHIINEHISSYIGTLNTSGGELASNGVFQQGGGIPPPLPSGGNHPAIAVGSSSTLMMLLHNLSNTKICTKNLLGLSRI